MITALTWPEAVVAATSIAARGVFLTVVAWSIFRTGQTAIKKDGGQRELVESLRADVDELRAWVERSNPSTQA
jgi:hypothetical protein